MNALAHAPTHTSTSPPRPRIRAARDVYLHPRIPSQQSECLSRRGGSSSSSSRAAPPTAAPLPRGRTQAIVINCASRQGMWTAAGRLRIACVDTVSWICRAADGRAPSQELYTRVRGPSPSPSICVHTETRCAVGSSSSSSSGPSPVISLLGRVEHVHEHSHPRTMLVPRTSGCPDTQAAETRR
ncbi:hypothetical protein C8Q80DRAFT_605406 [Daedaleopsis nitida]|nr:hypothetical protein C8Q80DRAFT_605406 [Daedaleopsis nitida]